MKEPTNDVHTWAALALRILLTRCVRAMQAEADMKAHLVRDARKRLGL
jgi:hypothetical protein